MGRRPLTEGQKAEKAARRRERERQQRLVARQAKQIEDAETHIVMMASRLAEPTHQEGK
ncbi:hypothetical protein FOPG_19811 [Fusarium oxysporum f. sp. conglutinans race 2 54008]|uniref:Uncharacterized protein n=1 Tax=Fusarium oxysporum f. sp. conglutinans race 2 54008 TaxID=1089457 RepID=X0GJW5_FUSOX|nr:hypothetical protein FOPG_19811 [Fusarium oxysporum f. sp. conglutinans race 2 54008]